MIMVNGNSVTVLIFMKECFEVTRSFIPNCREVCTDEEYQQMNTAFFEKEKNISILCRKVEERANKDE